MAKPKADLGRDAACVTDEPDCVDLVLLLKLALVPKLQPGLTGDDY
jgi:hypothetical protein